MATAKKTDALGFFSNHAVLRLCMLTCIEQCMFRMVRPQPDVDATTLLKRLPDIQRKQDSCHVPTFLSTFVLVYPCVLMLLSSLLSESL